MATCRRCKGPMPLVRCYHRPAHPNTEGLHQSTHHASLWCICNIHNSATWGPGMCTDPFSAQTLPPLFAHAHTATSACTRPHTATSASTQLHLRALDARDCKRKRSFTAHATACHAGAMQRGMFTCHKKQCCSCGLHHQHGFVHKLQCGGLPAVMHMKQTAAITQPCVLLPRAVLNVQ